MFYTCRPLHGKCCADGVTVTFSTVFLLARRQFLYFFLFLNVDCSQLLFILCQTVCIKYNFSSSVVPIISQVKGETTSSVSANIDSRYTL